LFLAAGAVIHSFADQQDIRKMGGLIKFLPFTYACMLVGSMSLLAVPFLTGFYSKDLIIELAYSQYSFSGIYAYILGSVTAGLTAFYSIRLISLVFLTVPNGTQKNYLNAHESDNFVAIPLVLLSLFSIGFGYIFADMFVGVGSDFFSNSIFIHPNNISLVEAEFSLSIFIKQLPAILTLVGSSLAFYLYNYNPEFIISLTDSNLGRKVYTFLNGKYLFDVIYNNYIIAIGLQLGYTISKVLDRGVIELIGPNGLTNTFNNTGSNIAKLDTGHITTYALYIALGVLSLVFFVFSKVLLEIDLIESGILIVWFFTLIVLHSSSDQLIKPNKLNPLTIFKFKTHTNHSLLNPVPIKLFNLNNQSLVLSNKIKTKNLKKSLTLFYTSDLKFTSNLATQTLSYNKENNLTNFVPPPCRTAGTLILFFLKSQKIKRSTGCPSLR
jgi:NADH-ubiquinone oxidoreductase chain 5